MKQSITKKQWDELSDDQEDSWFKFIEGNDSFPDLFANPNIGQMIEFLGDDWVVKTMAYSEDVDDYLFPDNKELCNQLWEACKYKLKE